MSLVEDLAYLLADLGHGTYVPAALCSIHLGEMGDQPDEAIAVARYAGPPGDAALPVDRPRIQFAVRGTDQYAPTESRAEALYLDLAGRGYTKLRSGLAVHLFDPVQSGPVQMPKTSRDRIQFVINFGLYTDGAGPHRRFS